MGYYSNKVVDYNNKYNDAISKLNDISSKLTTLKNAFNNAVGTDIDSIRTDLDNVLSKLSNTKEDISFAQDRTNRHTEKADYVLMRCTQNRATGESSLDENDSHTFSDSYPPTYYEDGYKFEGVPPITVYIDHNDELIHSKEYYEKINESDNSKVATITKEYYIEAYNLISGYQTWSHYN